MIEGDSMILFYFRLLSQSILFGLNLFEFIEKFTDLWLRMIDHIS